MTNNEKAFTVISSSYFMQRALALAKTNIGQTWPNPSVGAVIVKGETIIGSGCTAPGGRPHAETQALAEAGEHARGATLYVSLEPCSHHGKTPPCTDAIIKAGIAHVVIACRDPHPEHGGGIAQLEAAGISVTHGVCEAEARELNRGFFSVVEKKRPFIALKIATSADGKIAGGKSRWITGEASRAEVHRLRSTYDAVLTGIGTVLADDPRLTVRLSGLEDKSPVRVVLDRKGRLPEHSQLVQTATEVPLWVVSYKPSPWKGEGWKGVNWIQRQEDPHLTSPFQGEERSIAATLELLAEKGITRLLVEAGQGLNTAFMESGLVDRVYWFKASDTIGSNGLDAIRGNLAEMLADWQKVRETTAFHQDSLDIYERRGSRPAPG